MRSRQRVDQKRKLSAVSKLDLVHIFSTNDVLGDLKPIVSQSHSLHLTATYDADLNKSRLEILRQVVGRDKSIDVQRQDESTRTERNVHLRRLALDLGSSHGCLGQCQNASDNYSEHFN